MKSFNEKGYAMPVKKETEVDTTASAEEKQDSTLSTLALVFGLVSLTGPGLVFGIPAIVLGAIALKRKLPQRAMSITGLVTGIVSTVISLIIILFVGFVVIWAATHPEALQEQDGPHPQTQQSEQLFDSSRT